MFNSNGGYSLSDIAAVSGNRNGSGDGWGDGMGAWWIIILFLFVFCGWGNNGWGNGNGGSGMQGALTRADLCSEMSFNDMQSGIRGIQSGLCDGFYAQNTNLLTGFNGLQGAIASGFAGVDNAVCTLGYQTAQGINSVNVANMQNTNALQAQLADCCCENRAATKDVQYALATNTCAINTNLANSTRDIVDSQNANTRAILDAIQQGKIDAMQDKIATLTAEKQTLQFAASQAAQNTYLLDQLKPCPIPAYTVCNPFTGGYGYTFNNGCGCGGAVA